MDWAENLHDYPLFILFIILTIYIPLGCKWLYHKMYVKQKTSPVSWSCWLSLKDTVSFWAIPSIPESTCFLVGSTPLVLWPCWIQCANCSHIPRVPSKVINITVFTVAWLLILYYLMQASIKLNNKKHHYLAWYQPYAFILKHIFSQV